VEKDDQVSIHYTGTLNNGDEFDASRPRGKPLEFTVGGGQMIPGMDAGVVGMKVGETKKIVCSPAEAYGEKKDDAVITEELDKVIAALGKENVKVGTQVNIGAGYPVVEQVG
jgi:peptidylprolyl isomerase